MNVSARNVNIERKKVVESTQGRNLILSNVKEKVLESSQGSSLICESFLKGYSLICDSYVKGHSLICGSCKRP